MLVDWLWLKAANPEFNMIGDHQGPDQRLTVFLPLLLLKGLSMYNKI